MSNFKNITGLRFGRLVALERRDNTRWGNARWLCVCDCDATTVVAEAYLATGATKSCGCSRRELVAARKRTHGQSQTATYRAWRGMLTRCNNPRSKDYARYGARGRKVRFASFEAFRANMGDCPPGHDIHRKDNDKDYEPGNCVWLPHLEHMRLHAPNKVRSSAAK